jgi:hypothetical protein
MGVEMIRGSSSKSKFERRNDLSVVKIQGLPYEQDRLEFLEERSLKSLKEGELLRLILRERYDTVRLRRRVSRGQPADDPETPEQQWMMSVFKPVEEKFSRVEQKINSVMELATQTLTRVSKEIASNPQGTAAVAQLKTIREDFDELFAIVNGLAASLAEHRSEMGAILVPLYALQRQIFTQTTALLQAQNAQYEGDDEEPSVEYSQEAAGLLEEIETALGVPPALLEKVDLLFTPRK